MSDKCHLADEKNKQHQQLYSQTQGFQDFYLVNRNTSNMESASTSNVELDQQTDTAIAFDPSNFGNYYYDNAQWAPSYPYSQASRAPHNHYTILQTTTDFSQQSNIYPQQQYTTLEPLDSIHSVNTSLDNTYYSQTPSTTGNTPTASGPSHPSSYFSYQKQETTVMSTSDLVTRQGQDNNVSSPSSAQTPIPSPIISSKKRKRNTPTVPSPSSTSTRQQTVAADNSFTKKRQKTVATEEETDEEALTVNLLEKELSFLKDDCTTILIMLNSLRNAFLAGETSVQGDKTSDKRRRSKTAAQNTEIQREMRIAYDDLMLQVRQLEKKIEKLEKKSRHLVEENDGEGSEDKNKERKTK